MINRRHIRVKIMQSAYAMRLSKNTTLEGEKGFLHNSIHKMQDLSVLMLDLMLEVSNLAESKINLNKSKIRATTEDLNPNTKFVDNVVLDSIKMSPSFRACKENIEEPFWEDKKQCVLVIYNLLVKTDFYKEYMSTTESTYEDDKNFIISFFKEIIAKEEILHDFFEDEHIFWVDDIPVINTYVLKKLKNLKEKSFYKVEDVLKNFDDMEFSTSLFENYFTEGVSLEKQIIVKTPNWEFDRIALLDVILIKLALCEFNFYSSIPFRVTINEYIEISKEYGNEKSGMFINGILDRISKEYEKNNTVTKK